MLVRFAVILGKNESYIEQCTKLLLFLELLIIDDFFTEFYEFLNT